MPVFDAFSPCFAQAELLLQRGWSIIPLVGGADENAGKRPILRWQTYTRRVPLPGEMARWFSQDGVGAYGVVCGVVSGLVVLDLDDPALAERFAHTFPTLLDTFTVRSGLRGTPHLYWSVDFPVRTRAFPGGDLKAEGSYVVGPASVIAGHTWQILCDRPARVISRSELDDVLSFLVPSAQLRPEMRLAQPHGDFEALYRFYVERFRGRNQALFVTACHMRDYGCTESQVVDYLARLHAVQPSPVDGRLESFAGRYAEALHTIRSVYTRPARVRDRRDDAWQSASYYPNSVREALLSRPDGAAVARTVEAARLSGIAPGSIITEPLLCRLLRGVVSRETIRKALVACYDDGQSIFCPPAHPPALAEIPDGMIRQKNAFLSAGQKQTRQFILPDPETLCRRLGVQARGSDPITLEDVSSSRRYRQALHTALLKRRPGVYAQALLGARLGVSSRSIRRYNRVAGVRSQPTYQETPLLWTNLDLIPPASEIERYGIRTGGQFLIDDSGQRWPLKREIAIRLLSQGRRVSYMRQGCSHYRFGDAPAVMGISVCDYQAGPQVRPCNLVDLSVGTHCNAPCDVDLASGGGIGANARSPQDSPNFAREGVSTPRRAQNGVTGRSYPRKRRFRQPLPDSSAEHIAHQVYRLVDEISLANARRLVDAYGCAPVEAALGKFRWLRARGKVKRPAGLLVTLARIRWRARQRHENPGSPAPRFQAEPSRRSRATGYIHPKRDPLWKSAAYRDWRAEFFGLDDPLANTTLEEMAF